MPLFIDIDGNLIKSEEDVKLLGIKTDAKLSFDRHVDNICRKASVQLNILRRTRYIFRLKEITMVYKSFILNHFNYCSIVWHFCRGWTLNKMEKIQERALRLMYNDRASSFHELLLNAGDTALHVTIKLIVIEELRSITVVFKRVDTFNNSIFNLRNKHNFFWLSDWPLVGYTSFFDITVRLHVIPRKVQKLTFTWATMRDTYGQLE